jgi:hypothetical protein
VRENLPVARGLTQEILILPLKLLMKQCEDRLHGRMVRVHALRRNSIFYFSDVVDALRQEVRPYHFIHKKRLTAS